MRGLRERREVGCMANSGYAAEQGTGAAEAAGALATAER
jgi:hypothetical protein